MCMFYCLEPVVSEYTVYPKKYAHGFCFAVLCCGYTLTDFPISIRLTSLAMWQSNDCPSASKATLMNMDKFFMWIHYERLHNRNKAKHNKTVCIFRGIYCTICFNKHCQQYCRGVIRLFADDMHQPLLHSRRKQTGKMKDTLNFYYRNASGCHGREQHNNTTSM